MRVLGSAGPNRMPNAAEKKLHAELLRLPGREAVAVDIGDADLSHYRLEFTGHHDVSLSLAGEQVVRGHAADGGGYVEPEVVRLADVINDLNERFGLNLGTSDQILLYPAWSRTPGCSRSR